MTKSVLKSRDERLRRTRLYIPGNRPSMIQNAVIYGADSLIFDLEDSIPLAEKDAARLLVRNAIQHLDFGRSEVTVRINGVTTDFFEQDLEAIVPTKPDGLLLPKAETHEDILLVHEKITQLEKKHHLPVGKIKIMPIIETALGVVNVEKIVAAPRIAAVGLGGEDLTADIGATRTTEGKELEYISSKIIVACAAYQVQAIDTVYADINDKEGLYQATKKAISMGFQGKSVIHPSQIEVVHQAFKPSEEEVEKAKRILKAYRKSLKKGSGAISLDGRMIDLPVVTRAERILKRAKAAATESK